MQFTMKVNDMRITIEFDSCWQTSFLSDDEKKPCSSQKDNMNKPSSHGYIQKFVATAKARGETPAPITENTVLGILCRLIGYQKKLYSLKETDDFYFKDIQDRITFRLKNRQENDELLYVTNKSDDRCGQGTWLGVLDNDNPWFNSECSFLLWSILFLSKDELLDFILSQAAHIPHAHQISEVKPTVLIARLDVLSNAKTLEGKVLLTKERVEDVKSNLINRLGSFELKKQTELEKVVIKPLTTEKQKIAHEIKLKKLNDSILMLKKDIEQLGSEKQVEEANSRLINVVKLLGDKFPGEVYLKSGAVYPLSLYSAALYLQADRLIKEGFDLTFVESPKGELQIQGFSKRGFNGVRDWLNKMSGGRKKQVGTPCSIKKHTGILEIELNLDKESDKGVLPEARNMTRAQEILQLIENAGVSSFYLGKKGLAYVSNIRI